MFVNLAGFEEIALLAWRYPRPKVLDIPLLFTPGSLDDSHLPGFLCFLNSEAHFVKCPQKYLSLISVVFDYFSKEFPNTCVCYT